MDKKSKILLAVILLVALVAIGYTFYRYVIEEDYLITADASCDPETESCFYIPCEDSDCSTNIDYYKVVTKKAFNVSLCDPADSSCDALVCKSGEIDCTVTYCTPDNISDGEECSTATPVN
ncbi:MAG: hypothetical protein HQ402_00400 [Parcubacteria group bacterium]|nr:hypothetical protein [Parcubacteria group bacterium]